MYIHTVACVYILGLGSRSVVQVVQHTPNDDEDVEDDYGVPPDPSLKNTHEGDEDFMLD